MTIQEQIDMCWEYINRAEQAAALETMHHLVLNSIAFNARKVPMGMLIDYQKQTVELLRARLIATSMCAFANVFVGTNPSRMQKEVVKDLIEQSEERVEKRQKQFNLLYEHIRGLHIQEISDLLAEMENTAKP